MPQGLEMLLCPEGMARLTQAGLLREKMAVKQSRGTHYALAAMRKDGKTRYVRLHRAVFGAKAGQTVDHVDGNGMNNQLSNLRDGTFNQTNRRRQKHNTSGFLGVSFDKANSKWVAQAIVGNVHHWLGRHATKELAALARDAFMRVQPTACEYALYNFPRIGERGLEREIK